MATSICSGASGLPRGGGTCSTMASKSGRRSSPGHREIARRGAGPAAGVEHGKLDLLFGGVEIDEQVVDLVQDVLRPRVAAIDLVDDDNRRQAALEGLAQHVARLRQRALRRVDEQDDAVHHRQHALHFPAEVRVARRIDDVDDDVR